MERESMDTQGPVIPPPPDFSQIPAPPQEAPPKPSPLMSSPKGFYGPGLLANLESRMTGKTPEQAYEKRVPQLEATAGLLAPLVLPGGKAASTLGRMGQSALQGGAISGGLGLLGGKGPVEAGKEALMGAGTQAAAVPVGGAVRYLTSAVPKHLFEQKSGRQLANWFRQNVPAFSGMKGPRALYQMAKEGEQPLQDAFAKEFSAAKDALPKDAMIEIPRDIARKAGIKNMVDVPTLPSGKGFEPPASVKVPARDAAEVSLGMKDPATRRVLISALSEQGPQGWIPEARRAYQLGKGWQQYAANLFKGGETYDALEAQKLLRGKAGQALEKRGMTEPRDIIRGPLGSGPLKQYQPSPWAQRIAGLGLLGGGVYGHNPAMGAAGAALELAPRMSFYRGVPPTPLAPQLDAARKAVVQSILQRALSQPNGPQGLPPGR